MFIVDVVNKSINEARKRSGLAAIKVCCSFNADRSIEQCSLDSSSQSTVDSLKVRWSSSIELVDSESQVVHELRSTVTL